MIAAKPFTTTQITDIDAGIMAVKFGSTETLKNWLAAGNNPNFHNKEGWTPLLLASVRGNVWAVRILLKNPNCPADINIRHKESGALAVHFAGQSGDPETVKLLLDHRPGHLDAVWNLNGYTVLHQAIRYGHPALVEMLLKRGARTDITTIEGQGPLELALETGNEKIIGILRPFDVHRLIKEAYYQDFIKTVIPKPPPELHKKQVLSDQLVEIIRWGIKESFKDSKAPKETMKAVSRLTDEKGADVNMSGGDLLQPPLVAAVTGSNGKPENAAVEGLRMDLVKYLLDHGANPVIREKHPSGHHAVIKAAMYNHLPILKLFATRMTSYELAKAINEVPPDSGISAMHYLIQKALLDNPENLWSYIETLHWMSLNGARSDVENFTGVTPRHLAEGTWNPGIRKHLLSVLL